MRSVEFEVGGVRWVQAAVELLPPPDQFTEWWSAVARLAQNATLLGGAHLAARFEHVPGFSPRRFAAVILPREQADIADRWLGDAANLNRIKEGSALVGQPDVTFCQSVPDYVTELPIHAYSVSGNPVGCDFRLLPSLEVLMNETMTRSIPWSYQANSVERALDSEERRAARKNIARLEATAGTPERILIQQGRILDSAERARWRCAEFIGMPNRGSFASLEPLIAKDFADNYESSGFQALGWPQETDDDAVDSWCSGLHPEAFVKRTTGQAISSFIDKECLPALWTCRFRGESAAPAAAPYAADVRPEVFLSYSTRDQEAAFTTCRILEEGGIRCWIAPRNITPGREWAAAIVTGIQQSQVTVLLVSAGSNLSRYVLRELELTVKEGHPILPIRLEKCHLNEAIAFFLATHQWFDAIVPPFERHVHEISETLRKLLRPV